MCLALLAREHGDQEKKTNSAKQQAQQGIEAQKTKKGSDQAVVSKAIDAEQSPPGQ